MGLVCKTPVQIAKLATVYFIGYCVGDSFYCLIGRKNAVMGSLCLSMMAETVMIFVSAYSIRMIAFFVMGLFQLQNSASYLWLYESVTKS